MNIDGLMDGAYRAAEAKAKRRKIVIHLASLESSETSEGSKEVSPEHENSAVSDGFLSPPLHPNSHPRRHYQSLSVEESDRCIRLFAALQDLSKQLDSELGAFSVKELADRKPMCVIGSADNSPILKRRRGLRPNCQSFS